MRKLKQNQIFKKNLNKNKQNSKQTSETEPSRLKLTTSPGLL